jgi:hypothetical protein
MKLVFAGRAIGPWMNEHFLRHPRVMNFGETTPAESLRIAKACSAIFAHYKPFIQNHIYAAPNKLYDAMLVGIPLLINSECKISAFAQVRGFGLSTPFGDVEALHHTLIRLQHTDAELQRSCAAAQQEFKEVYAWQAMQKRWAEVFFRMGVPSVPDLAGRLQIDDAKR